MANRVHSAISRIIPQCLLRSAAKVSLLRSDTESTRQILKITATGGPPAMPAPGEGAPNHLTLVYRGRRRDHLRARFTQERQIFRQDRPEQSRSPTGWADWQLVVDKAMPHAQQRMDFTPVKSEQTSTSSAAADLPDGVRVRIQQNGETLEQWVPAGWQISDSNCA